MSGAKVARALCERFDEIRRTELARLHKKTAGLTEEQRAQLESITAQVVQAIARGPVEALEHDGSAALAQAAAHLFGSAPADRLIAH